MNADAILDYRRMLWESVLVALIQRPSHPDLRGPAVVEDAVRGADLAVIELEKRLRTEGERTRFVVVGGSEL